MLRLTAGFPRRVESKSCVYLTSESDCAKIHVRCHLSHRAYGPWVCVYVYWYTCICASSFSCVALDAPESHFHWCISLLSPSAISLSLSKPLPFLSVRHPLVPSFPFFLPCHSIVLQPPPPPPPLTKDPALHTPIIHARSAESLLKAAARRQRSR